ncbi:hypothetical protein SPACI_054490 [Sporomusa acidovorans DSM 3132]|uniref:GGDEF domain-containing protein n=2 Tax=Sporomusa TaxID=2375 RepID=A0ABZ3JB06_SPOA4|nr:GGDEF domain-containing protein [Sporomusa acidovorans]OZC13345.1 response regulator PleD [Sporomusa acidovorans DSM 3132]SDD95571.1 diguanylate cyclase (GGDEF) domain-containing protein [Sporomusa acidovorans]
MSQFKSYMTTIPFGVLLAAGLAYTQLPTTLSITAVIIGYLSFAVYGLGMILSWWFNRSRVFFIMVILACSQFALSEAAGAIFGVPAFSETLYPVICTLFPVNLFIFSRLKERGIFTVWGIGRFSIIAGQMFYLALAIAANDYSLLAFFYNENGAAGTAFSVQAVLFYGITGLLLARRRKSNQPHLENAIPVLLLASLFAFYLKPQLTAVPLFLGTGGIMLIIAVMQDSYSMAYLDELTGLPARRALKEDLMKLSGDYTIAMIDIDFFKKFNDTYGHDTGDEVLRLVASVLKTVTGGGKAFRYGGEEFTVLFPHTAMEEAIPCLEQLRQAVEQTPYAYRGKNGGRTKKTSGGKKLFVTISVGVAERSEKNKQTDEVIKAADTALYRAKKKGRNCVSK